MATKIKVSVIVVDEHDRILLLKEKVKKNDRPLWNIIKGTYGDNGEETIFEAAKRECEEEASIEVELTGSTGCYITGEQDNYGLQFNFIGSITKGEPKVADQNEQESREENISEVRWFSREEIIALPEEEFISKKIYRMVQDWLKNENHPVSIFKQI